MSKLRTLSIAIAGLVSACGLLVSAGYVSLLSRGDEAIAETLENVLKTTNNKSWVNKVRDIFRRAGKDASEYGDEICLISPNGYHQETWSNRPVFAWYVYKNPETNTDKLRITYISIHRGSFSNAPVVSFEEDDIGEKSWIVLSEELDRGQKYIFYIEYERIYDNNSVGDDRASLKVMSDERFRSIQDELDDRELNNEKEELIQKRIDFFANKGQRRNHLFNDVVREYLESNRSPEEIQESFERFCFPNSESL